MKAAIELTLAGLVNALRWRAHALADEAEGGYRRGAEPARRRRGAKRPARPHAKIEEPRDDRPGR